MTELKLELELGPGEDWLSGAGSSDSNLPPFVIKKNHLPKYFREAIALIGLLEPPDRVPNIGYRTDANGRRSYYIHCHEHDVQDLLNIFESGEYEDG